MESEDVIPGIAGLTILVVAVTIVCVILLAGGIAVLFERAVELAKGVREAIIIQGDT